jgi:hypothetical protein
MMNTQTTKKTGRYFRMLAVVVAMLGAMLSAGGVALADLSTGTTSPIKLQATGPADLYPSQVNVQNVSGRIKDVDVDLEGFSRTFPDDVAVLLVGPQGQKALLMSDVGGEFDVPDESNIGFVLSDEASNSLPDNAPMTDGFYRPTQGTASAGGKAVPSSFPSPAPAGPYATRLSVFDGTDPNGTWKLFVLDDSDGDVGQFAHGWLLNLTLDATPPKVTNTVPQPGATGVLSTANVRATFSENMKASTINATTFKLLKKGSTTKVAASVSYDATAHRATLDPASSLTRGATYRAVVTTDARDRAGNRLDQDSILSGLQQTAWNFKVRQ